MMSALRAVGRIVAVIAAIGLVVPAASASAAPSLRISVGGKIVKTKVCGRSARVHRVPGRSIPVRVAGARRAVVRVERCVDGSWHRAGRHSARRRGARLARAWLTVPAGTDLRVTAVAGRRASRRIYLEGISPTNTNTNTNTNTSPIVDLPISFEVQNVNRSALACSSDGQTYRLHGHLVAPAAGLASGQPAVTLYLHEFGFGEWFWHFPVPAYDYATQQAMAGHASVVIDRLGYDSSPGPDGNQICLGAQADMAHQVIEQLRAGSYLLDGAAPTSFARVAVAGHSLGGLISELEAYSFADTDAMILFGWADQGYSNDVTADGVMQGGKCAQGGEPAEEGGPSGYAYFASSPENSRMLLFHDAEPGVVEQAMGLRNRDPCGDSNSEVPGIVLDNQRSGDVKVPVLLVFGENDAGFSDPHSAGEQQKQALSGSSDVTLKFVPDTGHAVTLERSAPATRAIVSDWLTGHGF
jgi:pimeloyl-ACP methyl ester carboxylesterase